jgi:hypothetical protein
MEHDYFDLTEPDQAYFFAFLQADGHLRETTRNRGRVSVEVSERDAAILVRFSELVPCPTSISHRTRRTNFSDSHTSVVWSLHDRMVRTWLKELGLPAGAKSAVVAPPTCSYSVADYVRGWIDADGSVGITSTGRPFISLATQSESIALMFVEYVRQVTGRTKLANRNRRDGIFNLTVFCEPAQELVSSLNYSEGLALERKARKAAVMMQWQRPPAMGRWNISRRHWRDDEDAFLRATSDDLWAAVMLGRTLSSVKMRRWRMAQRHAGIHV